MEVIALLVGLVGTIASVVALFGRTERVLDDIHGVLVEIRDKLPESRER